MVGAQCLAQGRFSGGNFNVPVRGFERATFRHQDRSANRSATAAYSRAYFDVLTSILIQVCVRLSACAQVDRKAPRQVVSLGYFWLLLNPAGDRVLIRNHAHWTRTRTHGMFNNMDLQTDIRKGATLAFCI